MIVVLGASGMLGHKMFHTLQEHFPGVMGMTRQDKQETLADLRPEYVVNCIGVIKQRPEAADPLVSIAINSLLPHQLARAAEGWGGRVIHFSTDCVFSGARGGYTEEDVSDATDLYGRSKFLGEVATSNALTLRTSIIGRELAGRRSLLEWFLAQKGGTVKGYRRVIWSGVTTGHLSELVASIIRDHPRLNGLYQVASEPLSKYELLCLLRDALGLDIRIEPDDREVCDRSLRCDKLREAIDYRCPPWPVLARQLADENE